MPVCVGQIERTSESSTGQKGPQLGNGHHLGSVASDELVQMQQVEDHPPLLCLLFGNRREEHSSMTPPVPEFPTGKRDAEGEETVPLPSEAVGDHAVRLVGERPLVAEVEEMTPDRQSLICRVFFGGSSPKGLSPARFVRLSSILIPRSHCVSDKRLKLWPELHRPHSTLGI